MLSKFSKVLFAPPVRQERRREQVIVPDSASSFLPAAAIHTQLHKHRHCSAAAHPRNHRACGHFLIYYKLWSYFVAGRITAFRLRMTKCSYPKRDGMELKCLAL